MSEYEPRPHNYTANFLCGVFLETPVSVLRKVVPERYKLREHLPDMGFLALTFFDYTGGHDDAVGLTAGPYRSMVMGAVIAPFVANREQHPHTAVYPINFCIKDPVAVDITRRGEQLPVYESDWHFDYTPSDNGDLAIKMRDGDREIISVNIFNNGQKPRETPLYFQSISTDPDGTHRLFEATFAGDLYEHQKEDGQVVLNSHEAFRGLDVAEVSTPPILEMTMYKCRQQGQVAEAIA